MMPNKVWVFDLDDTLYKEIDFLKSAYREIALKVDIPESYVFMLSCYQEGKNAFGEAIKKFGLSKSVPELLNIYRNHKPIIKLEKGVRKLFLNLRELGRTIGLITDGRSIQQRHKIEALGLYDFISDDNILISEETGYNKPHEHLYKFFMIKYPNSKFIYVGDNLVKDFITPNYLGWDTICLKDNGKNIHSQNIEVAASFLPKYYVSSFEEIIDLGL